MACMCFHRCTKEKTKEEHFVFGAFGWWFRFDYQNVPIYPFTQVVIFLGCYHFHIVFVFFNIFSFLRHFFLSFICIYKYIEEFMKCPSVTLNNRRNNTHLMTTKLYIKRKMWYKHFFSIEFQERFSLIQQ